MLSLFGVTVVHGVFPAHLSSFPTCMATVYTRTNFPCPKAGMTIKLWNKAPWQGKIVNSLPCSRANVELVKENLPVCTQGLIS